MLYLLEVSFDGMIARFAEKLKLVENREIVNDPFQELSFEDDSTDWAVVLEF